MRLLSNERATPTSRIIRVALDGAVFPYRAGQAASLAAGDANGWTPYSIASAPGETARDGALEFLVKVDGSSRFGRIVDSLQPGTRIRVEGPAGTSPCRIRPRARRCCSSPAAPASRPCVR